jgi:hypothetical protein
LPGFDPHFNRFGFLRIQPGFGGFGFPLFMLGFGPGFPNFS